MRVVFMGTPAFAVPSLEALAAVHEVTLVVTRPDAVRSRGKALEPSAVKACALELGLDVLEATRIRDDELAAIRAAAPDAIAVAAFGAILPDSLIEVCPDRCINVHASLLPRWRGAAPIQHAILAGDERAGVSIMRVVHDLDAGAYCRQASTPVGQKGTAELTDELAHLGARELIAALADIEAGRDEWARQDESLVTLAPKVTKAQMRLDPADTVRQNVLRVQASSDAAPARLVVGEKGLRALAARPSDVALPPGAVAVAKDAVALGCADGALELTEVRPDGKRQMDAGSWGRGLQHVDVLTWKSA